MALGASIDSHLGVPTEVVGTKTLRPVRNQLTSVSLAASRDIGIVPAKANPQTVVLASNGKGEIYIVLHF